MRAARLIRMVHPRWNVGAHSCVGKNIPAMFSSPSWVPGPAMEFFFTWLSSLSAVNAETTICEPRQTVSTIPSSAASQPVSAPRASMPGFMWVSTTRLAPSSGK